MIELIDINKSYKLSNGKVIRALDNVNFCIQQGSMVGLIGMNGAGKSTLVKILSGILIPDSGICKLDGNIPYINREKNAKNIGVMFGQKSQLWWDLPLKNTFEVLKIIYDVEDKNYVSMMNYLIERFELDEFLQQPVRTLSLGQRMRAEIACILLHHPKIVFLDEPTIGLDIMIKNKIRDALIQYNQEYKTTFIITSHDMKDIEKLCNQLVILDSGKILFDGPTEKFYQVYKKETIIKCQIFEDIKEIKKLLFNKYDNLSISDENQNLIIKVDSDSQLSPVIIKYLASIATINKLEISDNTLEDLISQIYHEKKAS